MSANPTIMIITEEDKVETLLTRKIQRAGAGRKLRHHPIQGVSK